MIAEIRSLPIGGRIIMVYGFTMGVHVVMKNHHKRDDNLIGAKRISDTERTTKWTRAARPKWMSKKEHRRMPEFIEMRLCDVTVDTPGSRSEGFTIATTLLNLEEYPGAWLGSMYEGRWIVEPDIESIKCTLGLEHLRGQSPESLHRELATSQGSQTDDGGQADLPCGDRSAFKNLVNPRGQRHSCSHYLLFHTKRNDAAQIPESVYSFFYQPGREIK